MKKQDTFKRRPVFFGQKFDQIFTVKGNTGKSKDTPTLHFFRYANAAAQGWSIFFAE